MSTRLIEMSFLAKESQFCQLQSCPKLLIWVSRTFFTSFICTLFLSSYGIPTVEAALKIISVKGASNLDNSPDRTQPIVFGGTAGDESDCDQTTDTTLTCNNCTANIKACNTRRIYGDLILDLRFQIDSLPEGTSGPVRAFISTDSTAAGELELELGFSTSVGKDATAILLAKWDDICQRIALNGETECEGNALAGTLNIGIDANADGLLSAEESGSVSITVSTPSAGGLPADEMPLCSSAAATDGGICGWEAFPGDEKVFMESLEAADDFPNAVNLSFSRVRVFVSDSGFAAANPAPNSPIAFEEFVIETNSSDNAFDLDNDSLAGLINGQFYYFRLGVLDPANNLAYITSDAAIIAACTTSGAGTIADLDPTNDPGVLATLDESCPFMAFPDEVYGLWKENLNCFIATVAYGSKWSAKVQSFRAFRNQYLLPNEFGKRLVRKYYYYGKRAAHWVSEHPELRGPLRWLLWPVWLAVEAVLKGGLWLGGLVVLFFASLGIAFLWVSGRWILGSRGLLPVRRQ